MDQRKVTDYLFLIKRLIDSQEALRDYQLAVEAMFQMVLEKDLNDYPYFKIHLYLRELNDYVGKSVSLIEDLMTAINRIASLLMYCDDSEFNRDEKSLKETF